MTIGNCQPSKVKKIRGLKREVYFSTVQSSDNQVGQFGALNREYALLSFNVSEKSL